MLKAALHLPTGARTVRLDTSGHLDRTRLTTLVPLFVAVACAMALGATSRAMVGGPLVGFDDANIYMAYGRNFAAGAGFVYYPGGERVEGFTSSAWTIVTAAAYRLAESVTPELFLFALSVALVAITWVVLLRFLFTAPVTGMRAPLALSALFMAWCGSSPAYAIWMTTSLMETGLWSAVLCCGTVAFANLARSDDRRAVWVAAAFAGGAVAVRPEALLIVPLWIATTSAASWIERRQLARVLGAVAPAAAAYAVVVVALTAFRLAYFGYPLPNTYYAKLSPNRLFNLVEGLRYLRDFAVSYPLILPVLGGCAFVVALYAVRAVVRRGRPAATDPHTTPWVVVAVSLGAITSLPILTGGDHFAGFRVVQPVWPLFALFLVYAWASVPRLLPRMLVGLLFVVSATVSAQFHWAVDLAALRHESAIATRGRRLGLLLNEVMAAAPPPSIGVVAAGGVATTYSGPIIDLMGLNNVRMGHSPGERLGRKNHAAFSPAVFWELEPELVTPRFAVDDEDLRSTDRWLTERDQYYLRGLMQTPLFRDRYRLVMFSSQCDEPYPVVIAYCRRDWLAQHGDRLRWADYATAVSAHPPADMAAASGPRTP